MNKNERLEDHQKFKELAALAQRGALSEIERLDLESHLRVCASCQEVFDEYALISADGMSFLASAYGHEQGAWDRHWDSRSVRDKLMAQVRSADQARHERGMPQLIPTQTKRSFVPWNARAQWAAVAACVLVVVAAGAYKLGGRVGPPASEPSPEIARVASVDSSDKKASDELIASQNAQIARLQGQISTGQQEIVHLKDALRTADSRSAALSAENSANDAQLRRVSEQRDQLVSQLREAEQSYQIVQTELTTLRAERDRVLLRMTSLESKVDELNASARDQDRRLKDDEQYLASDRDIRELMGARKLYIADVFDVDSGSRTRKPFGRVFYTESKSLIFYAFDLPQKGRNPAKYAFEAWGQNDGHPSLVHCLGTFGVDDHDQQRWVLKVENPQMLRDINSVFVTAESPRDTQAPHGEKLLYAYLAGKPNHP